MTLSDLDPLRAHAPGLIALILMLGAGLSVLSASRRFAAVVMAIAAISVGVLALDLAARALRGLAMVYPLADGGLVLRVDGLTAGALAQLGVATAVIGAAGGGLSRGAFDAAKEPIAAALLLLGFAGLFTATLAGDLFTMALGLQLAGVAAAALTALGAVQDRRALTAAAHQIIAVGVAGAMVMMGAALLLRGVGSTDLSAIGAALSGEALVPAQPRLAAGGLALAALGLALQAGLAPMQGWAVLAVSRGPPIGALALGAAGLATAFYALLRIAQVAVADFEQGPWAVGVGLAAFGATALLVGAAQTLAAGDLRRFAFHAVLAHTGAAALLVALAAMNGQFDAAVAAFTQLHAAGFAALAVLAGAAMVSRAGRAAAPLGALDGFGRRAPLAAAALTVGLLALAGAPLTLGFVAKWLGFGAFLEGGWWGAALALAVATLAIAVAAARALARIWLQELSGGSPSTARLSSRLAAWAPLCVGAGALLLYGFNAAFPIAAARAAAAAFTGMPAP